MTTHGDFEKEIVNHFNSCSRLEWNNRTYTEIVAYKPRTPGRGSDCRTDVYVSLRVMGEELDSIKISVKKDDYEFLVNKMTSEDAESILGSEWKSIVMEAASSIQSVFESSKIITPSSGVGHKNIRFQLGWKLEITNKFRSLSHKLELSTRDVIDKVYRGTTQPLVRRHAIIDGKPLENAGIADYFLVGRPGQFSDAQAVISSLINLSTDFTPPTVYMVFTGHSYNFKDNKVDGHRALAVAIKWVSVDEKLIPEFVYNSPLNIIGSTHMAPLIQAALDSMNIERGLINQIEIESLR